MTKQTYTEAEFLTKCLSKAWDRRKELEAELLRVRGLLQRQSLQKLRSDGWMVAVHNDYRLNGELFTFWLLTKGDRFIKGEGRTDEEALAQASGAESVDIGKLDTVDEAGVEMGKVNRVEAIEKLRNIPGGNRMLNENEKELLRNSELELDSILQRKINGGLE